MPKKNVFTFQEQCVIHKNCREKSDLFNGILHGYLGKNFFAHILQTNFF